ncbi:MAG TPA: hypothetical protein VGF74_11665 [Thermoleophilaceae bacterium]|jgi:hypothetical protein
MTGMVKRVLAERAGGNRPSAPRAIVVAAAAGVAAAGITYRVLRG